MFREILNGAKQNKLMTKEAKQYRQIYHYKSGAQVLVKYFEKKIRNPLGTIIRTIPESAERVSASLARILVATNQAKVTTLEELARETL